ncbi:MAG TPA: glycosyltransferase [Casimicrobiaceae bacterium]|nr:glycosyltransferase [Casimicrobiaceae bacterium]
MPLTRRIADALSDPHRTIALARRFARLFVAGELGTAWSRLHPRGFDDDAYRRWVSTIEPAIVPPVVSTEQCWRVLVDGRRRPDRLQLERTIAALDVGCASDVQVSIRVDGDKWTSSRPIALLDRYDPSLPRAPLRQILARWLDESSSCWLIWFDGPGVIAPDALAALNEAAMLECSLVYGDDDDLTPSGSRTGPRLRPAFDVDLARGGFDFGPLLAMPASALLRAGRLDAIEARDRSGLLQMIADHDGAQSIVHIPRVLVHRTEPLQPVRSPMRNAPKGPRPLVSLVIPSRDRADLLQRCVSSIVSRTVYRSYEFVLVDNDSTDERMRMIYDATLAQHAGRVIEVPGDFNFPRLCNAGAEAAQGDVLVMLNNDTEVIAAEWLEELVDVLSDPDVGATGGLLQYESGLIQHAGVLLGVNGTADNALANFDRNDPAARAWCAHRRTVSAVLGACLATRTQVWSSIGGMDEAFAVSHNEVDFCLRLADRGLRTVFAPGAVLMHAESATRGYDLTDRQRMMRDAEASVFSERWRERLASCDPAYHPAFARSGGQFRLAAEPPHCAPRTRSKGAAGPARVVPVDEPRFVVLVLSSVEWNFRFQRPQQLARRFAADGHEVWYAAHAFGALLEGRPIEPGITELTLPGDAGTHPYRNRMSADDARRTAGVLKDYVHGRSAGRILCIVQLPFWTPLAAALRETIACDIVYDCIDLHSGFTSNADSAYADEAELFTLAHIVSCSSQALVDRAARHGARAMLVRNAADYDHFAAVPDRDADVADGEWTIGYYGAIADWFDSALVAGIARLRPRWRIVLIGSTWSADTAPLEAASNVVLAGEQPYDLLPDAMASWHCCMIPFRHTPLTAATDPVKVYEMLAAGKPVVSVPLPELVSMADARLVALAEGAEAFVAAIEREVVQDEPGRRLRRRAFGRDNTWRHRTDVFRSAVARVRAERSSRGPVTPVQDRPVHAAPLPVVLASKRFVAGRCNVCGRFTRFFRDDPSLDRESLTCEHCRSISRHRAIAGGLLEAIASRSGPRAASVAALADAIDAPAMRIYDTQPPFASDACAYPVPDLLRHCPWFDVVVSAYRPDRPPGATLGEGVVNQDLEALTFADETFDIVMTSDVMEHVRLDDRAHREIARVLKRGGVYLFTVPHVRDRHESRILVDVVDQDDPASDVHLGEPEYHGDPNDAQGRGALVYRIYGAELDDRLHALGFDVTYTARADLTRGIRNSELFYCVKR